MIKGSHIVFLCRELVRAFSFAICFLAILSRPAMATKYHCPRIEDLLSLCGPANNEGSFEEKYPNGNKKREGTCKGGAAQGTWIYWWESGKKAVEAELRNNKPHGRVIYYCPPSYNKTEEEYFQDGLRHGAHIIYFENGAKSSETHYQHGVKNGPHREWSSDGVLRRIDTYQNEVRIYEKDLWENGHEGAFRSGKKHGLWVDYLNGKPYETGKYLEGTKDGEWVTYYSNGNKNKMTTYRNGSEHGPYRYWDENGTHRNEGEFRNGKRSGTWTSWNESPKVKHIEKFQDGVVVWRGTYEANGNFSESAVDKNGHTDGLARWQDQGVKWEGEWKNNERHGKWTEWWLNGKLKETGINCHHKQFGVWTYGDGEGKTWKKDYGSVADCPASREHK